MPTVERLPEPTERVALRRFTPDDGPALFGYLADPEVVRFEPYGPMTAAECDEVARQRSEDSRFWAVCLRDGTLVGNLYLAPEGPEAWRTWTLGYVMNRAHWGHGYATEAATALIDHCFARGAHRIVAGCAATNAGSWRLLERLGLRREGRMVRAATFEAVDGEPVWVDTYCYGMLDTEWRAARPRAAARRT